MAVLVCPLALFILVVIRTLDASRHVRPKAYVMVQGVLRLESSGVSTSLRGTRASILTPAVSYTGNAAEGSSGVSQRRRQQLSGQPQGFFCGNRVQE